MTKKTVLRLLALLWSTGITAQPIDTLRDAEFVRTIYDAALTQSSCYDWLHGLCKRVGHRASGTASYMAGVDYTRQILDTLHIDKVWLQNCTVPHWERGTLERCRIINSASMGDVELSAATLGGSAPTPPLGITAEIIEVKSVEELEKLGTAAVKGKIVYFSRPMDPTKINTGHAYGGAVSQRGSGPNQAAKLGALGAIVRSMTLKNDDTPHSGGTRWDDGVKPIPAVAIGIKSAETLSRLLRQEPHTRVMLQLDCQRFKDEIQPSVIAEIKGSTLPHEVIVIGGHLDSWDIGEGAHDDGTGVVQSMAVLQILRASGYKPRRTIRVVLFANEEFGLAGGKQYAEYAASSGEKHIAAIESDGGGHAPRGFTFDGKFDLMQRNKERLFAYRNLLAPYGAYELDSGGSGADINPLKEQGTLLFGFKADSQRYFDYHHSRNDVFEVVHKRELELGAATMASLVYFLDKYGVK